MNHAQCLSVLGLACHPRAKMKIAFLIFAICLPWLNLSAELVWSTNVVADCCAYTGRVVAVIGAVQSVDKDGLSSTSYAVTLEGGLRVRVFFDRNQKTVNLAHNRVVRQSTAVVDKPDIGEKKTYTGSVKREMGKIWLITEKPAGVMR